MRGWWMGRAPRLAPWLALAMALAALGGLLGPAPVAAGERRCFPETGRCVENAFYAFWARHGELAVFGPPVGPALDDDDGRVVQFFERALLEWHAEAPPAFQVQPARLGAAAIGDRPETATRPGPCQPPDCYYADETGHTIHAGFLVFWRANGGVAVFGLPLTEEFDEADAATGQIRTVQYFERSRLEYDGAVTVGRLGAAAWVERPWLHDRPPVATPDYAGPPVEPPVRLEIPAIGVNAPITPVGVDAGGSMETPKGAYDVGWLRTNPRPGQPGRAVLAGHVDYAGVGPAVFWRLRELAPGAAVWVVDEAGARRRFLVEAVEVYRSNEAPLDRIFGASDQAHLNLITCTGTFNAATRDYDRRLVVYARWDGNYG